MIAVELPDETATVALAERISRSAQLGDIIALRGDLGTGKTAFARAFIRSRGNLEEEVPSPTFTLVQVYPLHPSIWHFDLYRLRSHEEAWERRLELSLTFGDRPDARRVTAAAGGTWRARLAAITTDA